MRWQLPAGVVAVLLLLLLFLPLWRGFSAGSGVGDPGGGPPPPPSEGPPPILVPTVTEVTSSPEVAHKSDAFTIQGRSTIEATGAPVPNATVAVFFNTTKDEPGTRVGVTATDAQGRWSLTPDLAGLPARDYQVVALTLPVALGGGRSTQESWSDPPLRLLAETRLTLDVPEREARGAPAQLGGTLTDDTGDPVVGAPVVLQVGEEPPVQLTTDEQGRFGVERTFDALGTYAVRAAFEGTEHLDPARAEARLEIVDVLLVLPARIEAVRGEALAVVGQVRFGTAGQAGVEVLLGYELPVVLAGEDGLPVVVERHAVCVATDERGHFQDAQRVAPTADLGEAMVRAVVEGRDAASDQAVVVVRARPNLTLVAPDQVDSLAPLSARLLDDRGAAMAGAVVRFEAWQGSRLLAAANATTRADGRAAATLDLGSAAGTAQVRAVFAGQGWVMGAEAEREVTVAGPLLALLAVAGGLVATAGLAWWVLRARPAKPGPTLTVRFPDLEPGVPPVWAPGEPVRVAVRVRAPGGAPLAGVAVQLHASGIARELTTGPDGAAETTLRFDRPSEVQLVATAERTGRGACWAFAGLRIADYRAEVGRAWRDLRFGLARAGGEAPAALAPREVGERLAALGAPAPEDLDGMIAGFERATYSPQAFGRADWVDFARRLAGVRDALGHREGAHG